MTDGKKEGRMSDEQFRILSETLYCLTPRLKQDVHQVESKGSFSNCPDSFSGYREFEDVEEFIDAIETYKNMEQITNEDALKGLPLLLHDLAFIWWKGIHREFKTWENAMTLLRENFSPIKPAYQIYKEFFETKQTEYQSIHTFVLQKRALLAKLPEGTLDKQTEIDFIYGLLNFKFRQHIPRNKIKSIKDLLDKGKRIERY
ncbi:activity-regulated cytoskeleton associated protein 2-like [Glossina fuscipes]|uniref:Activity-regulated cytoskeleton associated protein 2-like n=1 Tax=Glossina fuscipes TaxID=7396 RepID=A0A9C5Z1U6_9MUSC|nr:activity-regulated cytoskeleton associated protein 2-like [Glossina fuscipes]